MSDEKKKFSPILPYDVTVGESFHETYDALPYVRNMALTGYDSIHMESGNVTKNYRCKDVDAYPVGGEKAVRKS